MKFKVFAFFFLFALFVHPATAKAGEAGEVQAADPLSPHPPSKWMENKEEDHVYQQLSSLHKQAPEEVVSFLSQRIKSIPPRKALQSIIAFLWDRSYAEAFDKLNINYFLLLSDAYRIYAEMSPAREDQIMGFRNALISLHAFEIMAMSDAARCAKGRPGVLFKKEIISPRVRMLGQGQAYTTIQPFEYLDLIEEQIDLDERFVGRMHNAEICSFGMAEPPPQEEMFVRDYDWQSLREKSYDVLRITWTNRYQGYTQVKLPEREKKKSWL